ncbi:MAG: TMEM165/GDT1 family protein [Anaerolineae bacterium]
MNWRIALTTFGLLFLAELGDKTQLAVITMAARYGTPVPIFVGAVTALAVVTLIGVLCGEAMATFIPPVYLHRLAGGGFILFGALMLLDKI